MNDPQTFTRGRRIGIAFNVFVASVLAPAVAVVLIYLAFRPGSRVRLDWTEKQDYTLSDRTLKVIEDTPEGVRIYASFSPRPFNSSGMLVPGLDQVIARVGQHTTDLLREFEIQARGKIKVSVYDPGITGHIARIQDFSQRIGEPAANVVQVVSGQRSRLIRLDDLASYDEGPSNSDARSRPRLYGFTDEQAIAAALLSVSEERPIQIRFLTGHGERSPFAAGADATGQTGWKPLVDSLRAQNFEVKLLDLAEDPRPLIEQSFDILVVASPTRELQEGESARLAAFVEAGGKLFLTLDPDSSRSLDFAVLDQMLGLRRSPHIVCLRLAMGEWTREGAQLDAGLTYSPNSPIVKPLRDRGIRTFWSGACSFQPIARKEQSSLRLVPLVSTQPEAWQDLPDATGAYNLSFDPASEKNEILHLGFAVELPSGGRAAVFGDGHAFDALNLPKGPGNRDLGLNTFEWLSEREQLISIAPRPYDEVPVDLTPAEYQTILFYVMGAIPGLALVMAFAVFWTRRR